MPPLILAGWAVSATPFKKQLVDFFAGRPLSHEQIVGKDFGIFLYITDVVKSQEKVSMIVIAANHFALTVSNYRWHSRESFGISHDPHQHT